MDRETLDEVISLYTEHSENFFADNFGRIILLSQWGYDRMKSVLRKEVAEKDILDIDFGELQDAVLYNYFSTTTFFRAAITAKSRSTRVYEDTIRKCKVNYLDFDKAITSLYKYLGTHSNLEPEDLVTECLGDIGLFGIGSLMSTFKPVTGMRERVRERVRTISMTWMMSANTLCLAAFNDEDRYEHDTSGYDGWLTFPRN